MKEKIREKGWVQASYENKAILPELVLAPSKGRVGWTKNLEGIAVRNSLECLTMVLPVVPS